MKTNKTLLGAIGALMIVMLIGAGYTSAPITLSDALNRIRPGIGRHASVSILDANTTTSYFMRSAGGSIPACYPDRGTLVIGALAAATCCVAQAPNNLTIGTQVDANSVVVTDSSGGGNGNADCRQLAAGAEWTMTLDVGNHRSNIGSRVGVCSNFNSLANQIGQFRVKIACRVDADCTSNGAPAGTTCNLTPTEAEFDDSCLFAFCRATAASTKVWAHFER